MKSGFDLERRIHALERAARDWHRRECPESEAAIIRTLEAPNSFTKPALYMAVDRAMARITAPALLSWVEQSEPGAGAKVAVLNAGNVPFVGLQDFLAVVASGHKYLGITSRSSPYLLPAFAETVSRYDSSARCRFVRLEEALLEADAAIATGSTATVQLVSTRFTQAGIHPERQLLRGARLGVAILDGSEGDDDLFGLASDVLLHEGRGCRSVAVILAPSEHDPARFVEEANRFRRDFPPHERTLEATRRARRFLMAVKEPFFEGDGFVVVEGDVALREPCVVRWITYSEDSELVNWVLRHEERVQVVVGSQGLVSTLPGGFDRCDFGGGQDPPLHWCPDGKDTIAFLKRISRAEIISNGGRTFS